MIMSPYNGTKIELDLGGAWDEYIAAIVKGDTAWERFIGYFQGLPYRIVRNNGILLINKRSKFAAKHMSAYFRDEN